MRSKALPIPVHTENGLGKRQCTVKWKIAPIEQHLHRLYPGRPLSAWLGLTYDEIERLKDPRVKRNRNRWPLVDLKLRRSDCVEIVKAAGLPVPPWSACTFCPLHSKARWAVEASEYPEDFDEAVEIDEHIRERAAQLGKPMVWLSRQHLPLREQFPKGQLVMISGDVNDLGGDCESGYCHT